MSESGGGFKWLKYGCLGCLGVIGLFVLGAAVLSGVAYLKVKAEQVADRTLTSDLPRPEPVPVVPDDSPPAPPPPPTAMAGHVELDLQGGGFRVEPGPIGEPLRVEARYDENFYELVEHLEEEGDTWVYRLTFRQTGSALMATLKGLFGGTSPEVRVYLPPDLPMSLDLKMNQCGSEVELGGLWLTSADLEFNQGGMELSFDEPLREPVEQLSLHGSMGGVNVSRLGNASPRNLSVDYSMGGMNLDLRGAWVADSRIEITTSMSGTAVRLPRDVLIEGLDHDAPGIPPETEIPPPTLSFTVSGEDIEFR